MVTYIFRIIFVFCMVALNAITHPLPVQATGAFFEIRSIDVMKYSRDIAREMLSNPSFDAEIETQVQNIAGTGASHIAIGTPYDDEFIPFLERWVNISRRYGLSIWFRGNFAGWEEWFGYAPITRSEHSAMTKRFITSNPHLFQDGDIFTSCPECENGGPGDPRFNGDAIGHQQFLISDYQITKSAFAEINKDVQTNLYSMNGDVAKLIMDKETTAALDGIITVDHYVSSVQQLAMDIRAYAENSGGKVVLGEFGAPIPDLHGNQSQEEQAKWIEEAMEELVMIEELIGINYWVNRGGSTALWNNDNTPRKAVSILTEFFNPPIYRGTITDELGIGLDNVVVVTNLKTYILDKPEFNIPLRNTNSVRFIKDGYISASHTVNIEALEEYNTIIMHIDNPPWWYQLIKYLKSRVMNLVL